MIPIKNNIKKHQVLLLSFFIPLVIMLCYFVGRKMYPFGNSSLLTVDLGQQYIDFFSYFRATLLHHPTSFFYSFSQAIGGDMLGEWAYYLMSPFNLIFLLFPGKSILAGVMLVTLLKYALSGLTFGLLLKKTTRMKSFYIPLFATAYALMGWTIANQLNLLWLDAVILLPLVILGFEKLQNKPKSWAYTWWLALLLIVNYYMGYMVCLFMILYFLYTTSRVKLTFRQFLKSTWTFAYKSLISVAISAIILFPTLFSLLSSKGQYTEDSIKAKFEYNPLAMLSKLIIGSFNFDQMPSGFPNIFIGSLALIGFILYFMNKRFSIRERIVAFLITSFLILSMCFEPLDLLWHGMQFPVWYPYRFSFVFCFWIILLAAQQFEYFNPVKLWKLSVVGLLFIGMFTYLFLAKTAYNYLSNETLILSLLFILLTLILIQFQDHASPSFKWLLFLSVIAEMACNAVYSLDNISYLSTSEYDVSTTALATENKALKKIDHSFYRVAQTYSRTKNDAMSADFFSGSHFSSAFSKSIPTFYGKMGQPDGDNYVTYSNGTLVTDSLLDMKYVFMPKQIKTSKALTTQLETLTPLTEKPDTAYYKPVSSEALTETVKNPYALSIGYAANKTILTKQNKATNPLRYQSNWLSSLTGINNDALFTPINFDTVNFDNVGTQTNLTDSILTKTKLNKPGTVTFTYTPATNDAYYLTLGAGLSTDNVLFKLNGHELKQYKTYRNTVVVNIAANNKGKKIILTAKLKKRTLFLENFTLYHMDVKSFKSQMKQLKSGELKITKYNQHAITGSVIVKKNNQAVFTTIPYSQGWHVKVDGKSVSTKKAMDTFLSFKVAKGTHTIQFVYWPPYMRIGLLVSILALLLTLLNPIIKHIKRLIK
ncbi:YfhO family protein [Dellaglioa sp. L3N]